MVVVGIDFGLKHIGVSVGDTISRQSTALKGFSYKKEGWVEPLSVIIERWQPEKLIVGCPLNADGSVQPLTAAVERFVDQLRQTFNVAVVLVDERWTTVSARASLHASNKEAKVDKSMIDAESARLILAQWLVENA